MDDATVKELRVLLRQVQDHLLTVDALAGAQQESAGMVDVVYHPTDPNPTLNYVIPRRNTAWVPTPTIDVGLKQLREHGRGATFQYMEGLFPPQFGETLGKIGLEAFDTLAVYAFRREGIGKPNATPLPQPATDVPTRAIRADRAASLWAATDGWRRVIDARPTEPTGEALHVKRFAAYRSRKAAGLGRVEILPEGGTAQIVTVALADDTALYGLLNAAVRSAMRHGGKLVFALANAAAVPALQALQFVEIGQLKRYRMPHTVEDASDERVAQSVPAGR